MRFMTVLLILACLQPTFAIADTAQTPRLNSVENFRDVAGAGYITMTGAHMRTGILYRSNQLSPSSSDLNTLAHIIHVHRVYDLRTPAEIKAKPDHIPPGTLYTVIGLNEDLYDPTGIHKLPDAQAHSVLAEHQYLESLNRTFVTVPDKRKRLGILLTDIAITSGVQIFHCAAGKDRTGWVSAIIQLLVGIPRSEVIHDYLLTNDYAAQSIAQDIHRAISQHGTQFGAVEKASLIAYPAALEAGLRELYNRYGSIENYIHTGLGVSEQNITALKAMLITKAI